MKYFCDDDQEVYIGIYGVDLTEEKIIKRISKILGLEFTQTETIPTDFEELTFSLEFDIDTIVVSAKDYNEDFSELSEKGLGIYITP